MQIYRDGWQASWLSSSQGSTVEETTVVLRQDTNSTLTALSMPFSQFSMFTTEPFSTESIVDMWIQGTALQNAAVYIVNSATNVVSDAVFLSTITPEMIAVKDVFAGKVRIAGPDLNDWFRVSLNTAALLGNVSAVTDTWDTIVFKDVSGLGSSIYISEAQILPNQKDCGDVSSTSESGCIGSVCNSLIDFAFPLSASVPLYGFGPLRMEIANAQDSGVGVGTKVSMIARLHNGTTYKQVAEFCAGLLGMPEDTSPPVIFARSLSMIEARSDVSWNVSGVCHVEPTIGPLAIEQASAPVEWPLLTVVSDSFDSVDKIREMGQAIEIVRYFDKDGVAFATQNELLEILPSNAAGCNGMPWGLSRIDQPNLPLDNVYNPGGLTGRNVHIYVLDTGLNQHSDFNGRIGQGVSCYSGVCENIGFADGTGHGSHVAGTAMGTCYGVAKQAIIHPVKVLGDNGSGSFSGIINGIKWAVDNAYANGVRGVINMSLGGGASPALNTAVNEAVARGLVVAVAAGNEQAADACTKSPASASEAITTASTTNTDTASSFSNVGRCVDIWAPGSRIASVDYRSQTGYRFLDGTSMATPHVSGAAALYLEKYPSASPAQVLQGLLKASVQRNLYPGTTTSLLQAYNNVF